MIYKADIFSAGKRLFENEPVSPDALEVAASPSGVTAAGTVTVDAIRMRHYMEALRLGIGLFA